MLSSYQSFKYLDHAWIDIAGVFDIHEVTKELLRCIGINTHTYKLDIVFDLSDSILIVLFSILRHLLSCKADRMIM